MMRLESKLESKSCTICIPKNRHLEQRKDLFSPLICLTPRGIIIRTVEKSECLSVTPMAEQHR